MGWFFRLLGPLQQLERIKQVAVLAPTAMGKIAAASKDEELKLY